MQDKFVEICSATLFPADNTDYFLGMIPLFYEEKTSNLNVLLLFTNSLKDSIVPFQGNTICVEYNKSMPMICELIAMEMEKNAPNLCRQIKFQCKDNKSSFSDVLKYYIQFKREAKSKEDVINNYFYFHTIIKEIKAISQRNKKIKNTISTC